MLHKKFENHGAVLSEEKSFEYVVLNKIYTKHEEHWVHWYSNTSTVRTGIKAGMLLGQADFLNYMGPYPEVIKKVSCSIQLSMKNFLLRNVKMPTIVGILTFMSRKNIQF